MPTQDPGDRPDTVLPEHLRLPDLSHVRTVTTADLIGWLDLAVRAFRWGRAQRNDCWRRPPGLGDEWVNAAGRQHSPDQWTPADLGDRSAAWYRDGYRTSTADQPASITSVVIQWWNRGQIHRAHAPAALSTVAAPRWSWRHTAAPGPLADLLFAAWTDQPLTDADAHALLDQATPDLADGRPVDPHIWVAHVLGHRPDADTWTPDTRAWLALLTA